MYFAKVQGTPEACSNPLIEMKSQDQPQDSGKLPSYTFPEGFLWGAATSSHQVEGDNRFNDWWESEHEGRVPHRSGATCRHYELFREDFDLARSWGHNAHRFSIEWSRVQPAPNRFDNEALRHYVEVVNALKDRGMEPVVTLHHFTNPSWFARHGGWLSSDAPRVFNNYVERVVQSIGNRARFWLTINEPTVYVRQGYIAGQWPPFKSRGWRQAYAALHNLARAHRLSYRTIHQAIPAPLVSFAHNAPVIEPCRATAWADRGAAAVRDFVLNRLFFRLIGPGCLDFVGINYYTRMVVRSQGNVTNRLLGSVCRAHGHPGQGPFSKIGWESYPQGLFEILQRFGRCGLPLLVTENGIATDDEQVRTRFIEQHLKVISQAIESGTNVIGYLYWTLMDSFEWTDGMEAPFGLAAVDSKTQKRTPRPCVEELKRLFTSRRTEPQAQRFVRSASGSNGFRRTWGKPTFQDF